MAALLPFASRSAAAQDSTAVGSLPLGPTPLRAGTLVRPDTVRVGDRFVLVVSIQVPNSARIEWGAITDSSAVVAMRSPARVRSTPQGAVRLETATYDLAAWDVGTLPIGMPDAKVHIGAQTTLVPLRSARVIVKSVLTGDSTLRTPKPAKDLFPRIVPWWEAWWVAALVVAGLLLLWWIWRRRKRVGAGGAREGLDVYARALHDFERLERLALADAGEGGRYVALAVEVMRTYLGVRVPSAALSLTSSELAVVLADDIRVPIAPMLLLLEEADGIKFARRAVTTVRARQLATDARAIVEQIERAEQARRAAEDARRKAEEQAKRTEAQAADDEARRRSQSKAGRSKAEPPTSDRPTSGVS